MTLSSGGGIRLKPRPIEGVPPTPAQAPDFLLLDGQQRLTALYQTLRHPDVVITIDSKRQKVKRWYYVDMRKSMDPTADREEAIFSVPEGRRVTKDFGKQIVLDLSSPTQEYRQHSMPTERLMDSTRWMMGYLRYWQNAGQPHPEGDALEFFERFQDDVLQKFNSYDLPVINLDAETPKEAVCTVFEKVNTGGVVLDVFELATASFAADAEYFSLRDDWEARRQRMASVSGILQGISGNQFLQAVALLKTQEDHRLALQNGPLTGQAPAVGCKKKDILNLDLDDYRCWADKVEAGFRKAATFLQRQYTFERRNVPYNTQLVPLAALYVELGKELFPANAQQRLAHWYWSGVFGEAYGGSTETQFGLDLIEVAAFVRGGPYPRLITEANFVPERLITLRSRTSAAYKGVYALQMKYGAKDWISAEPLSLANYINIDIHHVFPVAWCQKPAQNIRSGLYDSIINKTPIDAHTNRVIGGRAPSEYLPRVDAKVPSGSLGQLLESHWLDVTHLNADNFGECFVARGEAMLELIGRAMGRELGSGHNIFVNALGPTGFPDTYIEDEREFDEIGGIGDAAAAG